MTPGHELGDPLAAQMIGMGFAFMLVLCRCAGAIMLLPGFGEDAPPAMLRAGIATGLAVLLTPVVAPSLPAMPASFLRLAGMVIVELMAGMLLGWLTRLLALALAGCGQLISLLTGLSSVLQPDAVLGAQSAAIGQLFNLLAPVLILATGLYAMPLMALGQSYSVIPAGTALPSGELAEMAVRAVSANFGLAVRLAAPFILVSMIWQIALGLLARLVPQIQVYFASMPGQVLGGILLIALLSGTIVHAWIMAARDGLALLP